MAKKITPKDEFEVPWRSKFLMPQDFMIFDPFENDVEDIPTLPLSSHQIYPYIFMSPDEALVEHFEYMRLSDDDVALRVLDTTAGPMFFVGVVARNDVEDFLWGTCMDRQLNQLYINGHQLHCGNALMDSGKVECYV